MSVIYLDNAATTLHKQPEVGAAMRKALETCGGAGRGGHFAAAAASEALYGCREEAARLFTMSDPARVILTSNATHALNIAVKGLAKPGKSVLISGYEHNAVVRPLRSIETSGVRTVVLPTPLFDTEAVVERFAAALMSENAGLAVCIHMSNVFGFVLPVERVAALCRERGVPLIVDASQSAGLTPVNGDLYPYWCMPGHKSLYGPQGTGLLLVPPGGSLPPLMEGGTGGDSRNRSMPDYLPERLESGTHNAPGVAGLAAGMRFVRKNGLSSSSSNADPLLKEAVSALNELKGLVRVYSSLSAQKSVVSFTVEGRDSESVAEALSKRGIAVRAGFHCAPLAHETAGTAATGTVRASFSQSNRLSDIKILADAIRKIAAPA